MNLKSLLGLILMIGAAFAVMTSGVTREIPVGTISGVVTFTETKSPFEGAKIVLYPQDDAQAWGEETVRPVIVTTDAEGRFVAPRLPVGRYRFEAMAQSHVPSSKSILTTVVTERETSKVAITMDPTVPRLQLYVNQHVYAPDETPEVFVTGFTPESEARVKIYQVPFERVVEAGDVSRILSPLSRGQLPVGGAKIPVTRELTVKLTSRDAEGVFNQLLQIPALEQGVYWMSVETKEAGQGNYLLVTKNALIVKADAKKGAAFVTDLKTGAPVAQADVSLVRGQSIIQVGKTDASGLAKFDLPKNRGNANDKQEVGAFTAVARIGQSLSVASIMLRSENDRRIYYVRTDRPVYRPGDQVQFTAFVRERSAEGLVMPAGERTGVVTLRDGDDSVLGSQTVSLDAHGRYSGSFSLPPNKVGAYFLQSTFGESRDTKMVVVSAYRKPEFRMVVKPLQTSYLAGEKVRMKVSCQYFFGGPVVGADLSAMVTRRDRWEPWGDEEDGENSDESSYGGDFVGNVSGVTDEKGEAVLEFDPAKSEELPAESRRPRYQGDSVYRFEVAATETGDKRFEGNGEVDVFQGAYMVKSELDRGWIAPGASAEVKFSVVDRTSGKPVNGAKVLFEGATERFSRNVAIYLLDTRSETTTGPDGTAVLRVSPKIDGSYRVRATITDGQGRSIVSDQWIEVWSGSGSWASDEGRELQITLDKATYSAGDTVRALIRSREKTGIVLLAVERENMEVVRTVNLKDGVAQVDLVVDAAWVPNANLTAAMVQKKTIVTADADLKFRRTAKALNVEVTPSVAETRPGRPVSFSVRVTDPAGKPVVTPVVLGVVDEAVYAIREDREDPIRELYPRGWSEVTTAHSLVQLYLDGGDKGVNPGEIRTDFKDTAGFEPLAVTDAEGRAIIKVDLPDNVTSWRATAIAISDQSMAGKGVGSMVARKPLMVRLSAPAYFSEGDAIRISAAVNNLTGKSLPVKLRLLTEGIEVTSGRDQSIDAKPDGATVVTWEVHAKRAGRASFTVTANGGPDFQDGMQVSAPIRAMTVPRVQRMQGVVAEGETTELGEISDAGTTTLRIRGSAAAGLATALESLVGYPYGCTEQTMSRFMPAVVAQRVAPGVVSETELKSMTDQSLARLERFQHGDGGWGWWEFDTSEPLMTAIVLDGLYRAQSAGIQVKAPMLNRALNYAAQALTKPDAKDLTGYAMLARARAMHEPRAEAGKWLDEIAGMRPKDPDALAELALGYAYLSLAEPGRAGTALPWIDAVLKDARFDRSSPWPQVKDAPRYYAGQQVERAARVLEALLLVRPSDPRVQSLAEWMAGQQRGKEWFSTRDTNAAIVSLAEFAKRQDPVAEGAALIVRSNGKEIQRIDLTLENILRLVQVLEVKAGKLTVEAINTKGFYSLETRQDVPADTPGLTPADGGVTAKVGFHALTTEKNELGRLFLTYAKAPSVTFKSGDQLQAVIEWTCDRSEEFVMVEVPFPATLKYMETAEPEYWNYWFTGMQILDDRAGILIRQVPEGKSTLVLNFRAEAPGTASIPPVKVFPMYWPERAAYCAPVKLVVTP